MGVVARLFCLNTEFEERHRHNGVASRDYGITQQDKSYCAKQEEQSGRVLDQSVRATRSSKEIDLPMSASQSPG